jgi:hypothetical protein
MLLRDAPVGHLVLDVVEDQQLADQRDAAVRFGPTRPMRTQSSSVSLSQFSALRSVGLSSRNREASETGRGMCLAQ